MARAVAFEGEDLGRVCNRINAALKAAGADVRYTEYPGVGHNAWDWDYEQPPMITWMLKQAKKQ